MFISALHSVRPPGVFEYENFAEGSKAFMDAVVMATEKGATTIIGQSLQADLWGAQVLKQ